MLNYHFLHLPAKSNHGSDYIAIGLIDGKLVFRFDLGSGMADLQTPLPIDGDVLVHTVHIGRKRNEGWMKVKYKYY